MFEFAISEHAKFSPVSARAAVCPRENRGVAVRVAQDLCEVAEDIALGIVMVEQWLLRDGYVGK